MGLRTIPLGLSMVRQAISIEHEFGVASLIELARVAEFLEHAFYVPRSLVRTARGVAFRLHNPPLRVGAFRAARGRFDGVEVPAPSSWIQPEDAEGPRAFDGITADRPLVLPLGGGMRVELAVPPPSGGRHTVRLELQSIAIPPLVWIEIEDTVREEGAP